MHFFKSALLFGLASVALAQEDPLVVVPAGEQGALYPPYTYRPSVFADYKPHPHGLPFPRHNFSLNPSNPFHRGNPPGGKPPGLPPIGPSNPSDYWYEKIKHDGTSPFIANGTNWQVYRNVKDFGAKGDGKTDDSAAIQAAINFGGRGPGGNGLGTTGAPAVIYFPVGTYLMHSPIQLYVDTLLIGNPIDRPSLKASSSFNGTFLVFGKDPALDATINFYIALKNLILDSTSFSPSTAFTLLDWSVSQATQLTNTLFSMPQGSQHTGVSTPEGGSGTYMGDLKFSGGTIGINHNNQQYSIKNVEFDGTTTGVVISHGFDIVFQGLKFSNNKIGINATAGGVGNVGSYALVDSLASSVDTLILTKSQNTTNSTTGDDSVVIDNLQTLNVAKTVVAGTTALLTGSVPNVWVYGNAYLQGGPVAGVHDNGVTSDETRSPVLLSGGKYFTMAPPTYQEYSVNQVVNIKDVKGFPVYGDGQTDDTDNINVILARNAGCAVTFFPAGTYLVTDTVYVPPGSRIVGEAWAAISAVGSKFASESNPHVMVQVGNPGDVGIAQISDILFTVADVLPGCILFRVNMAGLAPGDVATWNTHFRVGGAAGSAVETKCTDASHPCQAAFLLLHLTPTASVYIEDMWGWTADHDLDGDNGQTISTGRGALVESTKGTWLVGTAFEHNTLYQYNLVNAQNLFIGMQQSETPYWQGTGGPAQAPAPWTPNGRFGDPSFSNCVEGDADCRMAWYERIDGGSDLYIYGSGFWTFFNDLGTCLGVNGTCQTNAAELVQNPTKLFWWNLNTRGVLNLVIDHGQVEITQNSSPGSWGGVVAAVLTHSGLNAGRMMKRFVGARRWVA